ncbi:MAG: hypothetical protein IMZ71_02600 [Chloroflexi bacterium]|nr:hypothetical protein [Chloroflexota bacterium]
MKKRTAPVREARAEDVKGCARCGGNHKNLLFEKLTKPAKDYQWWALCPFLQEPILMRAVEAATKGEQG